MEIMEQTIKHPVFAGDFGTYSWCLHCERAGLTHDWISKEGCPFCDADYAEQWRWEQVCEANPNYPAHPQIGKEYSLYGRPS